MTSASGAGLLARFSYGYDLNHANGTYSRLGQRGTMTADVPAQGLSGATTKYLYDDAYQLIGEGLSSGASRTWNYDAIGSSIHGEWVAPPCPPKQNCIRPIIPETYTYQTIGTNTNNWHRLLSVNGTTAYTYDANGNATTRTDGATAHTYGWDASNRVTSIMNGTTPVANYRYDYQGRRTSKTVDGVTTTYLCDGLNLIAESGASYLYGPGIDEPLAVTSSGAIAYYATDGLGSVNVLADPSGAAANSYVYDAWGVPLATAETLPQPLRYTARARAAHVRPR